MYTVGITSVVRVLALDDHQKLLEERKPHLRLCPGVAIVGRLHQGASRLGGYRTQPAGEAAIDVVVLQRVDAIAHLWVRCWPALEDFHPCTVGLRATRA